MRTPNQLAALLSYLAKLSWEEVMCQTDAQAVFDIFYATALSILDMFYPNRTITTSNRDPYFVTPHIKSLLRRRNRFMHRGNVAAADSLTKRIGERIAVRNKTTLTFSKRGSKEMWEKVRLVTGKTKPNNQAATHLTAEQLNQYFAAISTDPQYKQPIAKTTVTAPCHHFTEYGVFRLLGNIKPTSTGLDLLPDWYLRLAAPSIALPLSYLFNLSLQQSTVPLQWKVSSITPVPKVPLPQSLQEYRPISVTPILSRIMEKQIITSFFYPVLTHPDFSHLFSDQFAFRPTGSTTVALICLLHQLTNLLQTYDYVHLIALDFSKAFDTVRHHTLLHKMTDFPLPDCLYNWIIQYLSDRQHQTKVNGNSSTRLTINASIIQGSGLGPVIYVINASDLHPVNPLNIILKYADDTYLIVPSINSNLISLELQHLSLWASENNLKLNVCKSCEMIVHSPHCKKQLVFPNPLPNIARVQVMNILGVSLSQTITFTRHIQVIIEKAARSLYALKTLRIHGLEGQSLWDVTRATLVAQILYASPAWWGFLKAEDSNRLQSVLSKAKRYGFLPRNFCTLHDLCESADKTLFQSVFHNPNHVLHQLLPPVKITGHNTRTRIHNLALPSGLTTLSRNNFIDRMLFTKSY